MYIYLDALLADGQRLADAEDALHARVEHVLELGGQRLVGVHREDAELAATLGVAEQHLG